MSKAPDHKTSPAPPVPARSPAFLTVFPSIMLPMFLAVVDQTIVATALPAIAAATGEVERASWIVVAYLIAATIAAPIYGRLGDLFGRRRLMFVALGVFIARLAALRRLPHHRTVDAGARAARPWRRRIDDAVAGAGRRSDPAARTRALSGLSRRGRGLRQFASGPVAGGYLTEHFGWQSIFLVNIPIGLGAVGLTWRLPNPNVQRACLEGRPRRPVPVHGVRRDGAARARASPACRSRRAAAGRRAVCSGDRRGGLAHFS